MRLERIRTDDFRTIRETEVELCLNKNKLREMCLNGMDLTDEHQTLAITITNQRQRLRNLKL